MSRTPGKWAAYDRGVGWEIEVPDLRFGTRRLNEGQRDTFTESDARLIAAAPDLLEVLKAIVAHVEKPMSTDREIYALYDAARAVIAKAEGQ